MENLSTTDSIMKWFTTQVQNKESIDPHVFLEGALKLSVLLQSDQETLILKEQEVAILRRILLEQNKTVAYAKTIIEATDEYKDCRMLKAKIDRAIEFIRTVKLYSRTASELMRNQL